MKHYVSKSAVCPFYRQEERQKVHCEGLKQGMSTHLVFTGKEQLEKHKEEYCCNLQNYINCPIYEAVAKKCEEVET